NKTLDGLVQSSAEFSISATLKHLDTTRRVSFDACYMEDKEFSLDAQTHGETVYSFTATRVRGEERGGRAVRVDPLREEVRADDRAWPFALDCRADVATIELGGVTYRVRPLRWREKRNLARYASLGEEFVERQLVRACLEGATPLPADRQQYE